RSRSDDFLALLLLYSSGSSVPARRVLSSSDDLRPSSGSSVPARRRDSSRDGLLPCSPSVGRASDGVVRRGLANELPLSMLLLRSSSLDIALGLVLTRIAFGSAAALGRRCAVVLLKPLTSVGVVGFSACTGLGLCDEVGREYSS